MGDTVDIKTYWALMLPDGKYVQVVQGKHDGTGWGHNPVGWADTSIFMSAAEANTFARRNAHIAMRTVKVDALITEADA